MNVTSVVSLTQKITLLAITESTEDYELAPENQPRGKIRWEQGWERGISLIHHAFGKWETWPSSSLPNRAIHADSGLAPLDLSPALPGALGVLLFAAESGNQL